MKNKCLQILDTLHKKPEKNLKTRFISDSIISQKQTMWSDVQQIDLLSDCWCLVCLLKFISQKWILESRIQKLMEKTVFLAELTMKNT